MEACYKVISTQTLENDMKTQIKIIPKDIYVKGLFESDNKIDLLEYFKNFGKVVKHYVASGYAFITFSNSNAVEKVMAVKKHEFRGEALYIKSRNTFKDYEEDKPMLKKIIVSKLEQLDNFEEEYQALVGVLQPNFHDQLKKYKQVYCDLRNCLSEQFPDVVVHPFGSTAIGLNFQNSDVDIHLSNVMNGGNELETLLSIRRLLGKSKCFVHCFMISTARVPLVKGVHKWSRIHCDLNIKSLFGVHNSNLIRHYLDSHAKVKQAMIVIKYWGKCAKLIGKHSLFTNYCLCLLFIFFLQQTPYDFPSVYAIQDRKFGDSPWSDSVQTNHRFPTDVIEQTPLKNIVEGFFRFYENFDFTDKIISLYLGKALPLNYFESPSSLPPSYQTYRQLLETEKEQPSMRFNVDCLISVQDPFEHSRNVSSHVCGSTLRLFKLAVAHARTIFSDGHKILYRLYTEVISDVRKPARAAVDADDDVTIKLTIEQNCNLRYLTINQSDGEPNSIDERWFEYLERFLLMVFRDLFRFTDDDTNGDEQNKVKAVKNDEQKDIHDVSEYRFSTKVQLWTSRKSTAKNLKLTCKNRTFVEKELAVTKHLLESCPSIQHDLHVLSVKMRIVRGEKSATVLIEKLHSHKKTYNNFRDFVIASLPIWFRKYENDLNNDALKSIKSSASVD